MPTFDAGQFSAQFDVGTQQWKIRVRPAGSDDSYLRTALRYQYDVTELDDTGMNVTTTVTSYSPPVDIDPLAVTVSNLSAVDAGLLADRLRARQESIHASAFEQAVV